MTSSLRRNASGVLLAAMGLVGLGVLVGLVVSSTAPDGMPPDTIATSSVIVDVPLSEYDGAIEVQLLVTTAEQDPLRLNVAGRVTAVDCRPGQPLASGDSLLSIDGRRIRLLATSTPMWRDLRFGDTGEDVAALQFELRRLGFAPSESGWIDSATVASIRDWLDTNTLPTPAGVALPLAAIVWSPAPTITPATCDSRLDDMVTIGDAVLTPSPVVTQVAVPPTVSALSGREHLLAVGSVAVPLSPSGAVTDPGELAAIAATPEFAAWLPDRSEGRPLLGTVSLDVPIEVGTVPPAAVVGVDTARPCLIGPDGRATTVLIVSSRLGQTIVAAATPDSTLPPRALVDSTGNLTCPLD